MRIHYFYKKDYRKGFYDLTIVAWLEEKQYPGKEMPG